MRPASRRLTPIHSQPKRRRRRLVVVAATISLVLGLFGVGVFALFGGLDATVSERASGPGNQTVRVDLVDAAVGFDVTPDELVVGHGAHVMLEVANKGQEPHDLVVPGGPRTKTLSPGQSQRLDLGVVTTRTPPRLWCTLPGHKGAGMVLDLRVVAS